MVNRYTSDKRIRSDDAYTPGGAAGTRPDRSVIVYSQRCARPFARCPIVIGGIEASLRRIAHFDYWSEKVRRSVLLDAKADLLVYGNAERRWWSSRSGSMRASRSNRSATCAARRSCAAGTRAISSRSIRATSMRPVRSIRRSIRTPWKRTSARRR